MVLPLMHTDYYGCSQIVEQSHVQSRKPKDIAALGTFRFQLFAAVIIRGWIIAVQSLPPHTRGIIPSPLPSAMSGQVLGLDRLRRGRRAREGGAHRSYLFAVCTLHAASGENPSRIRPSLLCPQVR